MTRLTNTEKTSYVLGEDDSNSTEQTATTSNLTNISSNSVYATSSSLLSSLGFKPQRNILDDYYQVAYHFQFSMINPYSSTNRAVLAETGATEIDIISVEAQEAVAPNYRTKNTTWAAFEMTLFEPMGANLLDLIANAGITLNVDDVSKTIFYLSLSFKGYNSSGVQMTIGESWNWPVIITNLNTVINEAGATYKIQLQRYVDTASLDNNVTIPFGYQFSGSTLKELMTDLFSSLNTIIEKTYTCPFIKYVFKSAPYPTDAQAPVASPGDLQIVNASDVLSMNRNPDGGHTAGGTNIGELINQLISASTQAAKLASNARIDTNGPADIGSKEPDVWGYTVITDVVYGTYRSAYADYDKTLIFTVVPYRSWKPITNIALSQDVTDASYNQCKLKQMIQNNVLNKEYNYLFTGLNTEILDLTISSNFNYMIIQEYIQGIYQQDAISTGQVYTNQLATTAASLQQQYNQLLLTNVNNSKAVTEAQNQLSSDTTSGNQSAIAADQAALATAQANLASSSAAVSSFAAANPTIAGADETARASSLQKLASTPNLVYEDNVSLEQDVNEYTKLFRIGIRSDISDHTKSTNYNVASGSDNKRSMYSAMMDQMYEETGDALQEITMTIRGDPYWLGASFMGNNYSLSSEENFGDNVNTSNDGYYTPKIFFNDNCFMLKYNTPEGFDDDGKPILKANDYYTGIYVVTDVTHSWSNGLYKQILHGTRIPGIILSNILSGTA